MLILHISQGRHSTPSDEPVESPLTKHHTPILAAIPVYRLAGYLQYHFKILVDTFYV